MHSRSFNENRSVAKIEHRFSGNCLAAAGERRKARVLTAPRLPVFPVERARYDRRVTTLPLPFVEEIPAFGPLADLPNPKPSAWDKRGFGRLASLYTSFSTEFAHHAATLCVETGRRRILDPFAGLGTLGEAARGLPVELMLADLNPFAALSCAYRTSPPKAIAAALDRFSAMDLPFGEVSEEQTFRGMLERAGQSRSLRELLGSHDGDGDPVDGLTVFLVAALRIRCQRRLTGSNPTWTARRPDLPLDAADAEKARSDLIQAAADHLRRLGPAHTGFSARSEWADVRELGLACGDLDAIVTSPPYPNRTDYFRHFMPAAELLIQPGGDTERRLREAQIGTPLIRTASPPADLPAGVASALNSVRTHASYASESYYAKTLGQYFEDMRAALSSFADWLRPGGWLLLVVQDLRYKELRLPIPDLIVELAMSAGDFALVGRRDFQVQTALSNLSPHSRGLAGGPRRESALLLARAQ